MGHNFVGGNREQLYLLPPSVTDWLPGDHLAWFVIDVVDQLDLSRFERRYRADGRGGAAYDPALMVAVLIYAYCVGERSSRRIERRLIEDVAFRVVAANVTPDHATLARFRAGHEAAIEELFAQVLALCVAAGLVTVGVVALDGTKMEASASMQANRDADGLEKAMRRQAHRILEEAAAVDAAEDAEFGDRRGDELPPEWADRSKRLARLRAAKARLEEMTGDATSGEATQHTGDNEGECDVADNPDSPDGDVDGDVVSGCSRTRRSSGATARVNVTDPDSRLLKRRGGYCQGYNAQAAATENQVIVAAKLADGHDVQAFDEMVELTKRNLLAAGAGCPIEALVADAGYYSTHNASRDVGVPVLIATRSARHRTPDTDTDDRSDTDADRDGTDVDGDDDQVDPIEAAQRAEATLTARRAGVLQRVVDGELSINAAARELGLCWKTTRDLLARYQADGAAGIVRRRRANGEGPNPDTHAARDRRVKAEMDARLADPVGHARYKKRSQTIEPVFGQIKDPRGIRRFQRRGRTACESEWQLITATHNVLKLWRTAAAA